MFYYTVVLLCRRNRLNCLRLSWNNKDGLGDKHHKTPDFFGSLLCVAVFIKVCN